MHEDFLQFLCCPQTGQLLTLKIAERFPNGLIKTGQLITKDRNFIYPIKGGIPRFIEQEHYADTFGFEWKKWSRIQFENENINKPMQGHTERMFYRITGASEQELSGKLVIEFGCGPGRFIDIVRKSNGIVVGIDMSLAVESARENFQGDKKVLIVQGDLLNPPFKKDSFDFGYTIGVLHHTPDPYKGLEQLHKVVKPNGKICVCVYPKRSLYAAFSVLCFRKIHQFLRKKINERTAINFSLSYSYFSAYCLYYLYKPLKMVPVINITAYIAAGVFLPVFDLPDVNWRVLDTFDAITPEYASTHTSREVQGWLSKLHCRDIKQTDWCNTFPEFKN